MCKAWLKRTNLCPNWQLIFSSLCYVTRRDADMDPSLLHDAKATSWPNNSPFVVFGFEFEPNVHRFLNNEMILPTNGAGSQAWSKLAATRITMYASQNLCLFLLRHHAACCCSRRSSCASQLPARLKIICEQRLFSVVFLKYSSSLFSWRLEPIPLFVPWYSFSWGMGRERLFLNFLQKTRDVDHLMSF